MAYYFWAIVYIADATFFLWLAMSLGQVPFLIVYLVLVGPPLPGGAWG